MSMLVFILLCAAADEKDDAYKVIVHPKNDVTVIERRTLEEIYLKRATRWPNGDTVKPVDLAPELPARARFSKEILARSVAAVKNYWQSMIFAGREIPPPEFEKTEDVLNYVLTHPGAVAYVPVSTPVGTAKLVTVK